MTWSVLVGKGQIIQGRQWVTDMGRQWSDLSPIQISSFKSKPLLLQPGLQVPASVCLDGSCPVLLQASTFDLFKATIILQPWNLYLYISIIVMMITVVWDPEMSLEVHVCFPEKIYKVFISSILVFIFFRLLSFNFCCFNFGSLQNCMTGGLPKHLNFHLTPWIATYYSVKNLGFFLDHMASFTNRQIKRKIAQICPKMKIKS